MAYWQKPPTERDQIVLFAPTLEARIPEDHPVRLLDCTAFNLAKLIRHVARLRAEFAALASGHEIGGLGRFFASSSRWNRSNRPHGRTEDPVDHQNTKTRPHTTRRQPN